MNNLLNLQQNHRSQALLTGNLPETLSTCPRVVGIPWDERYTSYVTMSGFKSFNNIGQISPDNALITALVERWHPETHTFHLPVGEITITLEDVAILFGLRVDGEALCLLTEHDWPAAVTDLLGNVDATTFRWRGTRPPGINISWLYKTFSNCPWDADERTVQQYARAYLLMLVGTVLFPHRSRRDSILAIYLPLFRDFQEAGGYSWGSAVLAFLYRELCTAAMNSNQRLIGGATMLLQMWSWERFYFGRPIYRLEIFTSQLIASEDVNERPPLGYFLSGHYRYEYQITNRSLQVYCDAIERLDGREVNWQPYEGKRSFLPPICSATPELWRTNAPLIHFWIVEMYNPHRVLRQFGRYQHIPPFHQNTITELHEIQDIAWQNWPVMHAAHLQHWRRRWSSCLLDERLYDPSMSGEYIQWFASNSILYLLAPPGFAIPH